MPELPEARSGWQRRIVSAVSALLSGSSDETVRAGVERRGRFLTPELVDEIMGAAYAALQAGSRATVSLHSGENPGDRPIRDMIPAAREAVVHITIDDTGPVPVVRQVRIPINEGMTGRDLRGEIQDVIDAWNSRYDIEIMDDAWRIAYIT